MKAFTEEKIRVDLKEIYAELIQKIIEEFLEGDLKNEIHQIKLNITTMQGKLDFYKGEKKTWHPCNPQWMRPFGVNMNLNALMLTGNNCIVSCYGLSKDINHQRIYVCVICNVAYYLQIM